MKIFIFTILLAVCNLLLISAGTVFKNRPGSNKLVDRQNDISCAPPLSNFTAEEKGKFINVLRGLGHHTRTISTTNDSTQVYFNQGLNFYFSYHFREALASFKEAARFDPACALTYWGQALSMGPFYNEYFYKMRKEVPEVVKEMKRLGATLTGKEKRLIEAMQLRYSEDLTNADRRQLDSNYAAALHQLTNEYKTDNDIAALYIDAVMLQHKWDFWTVEGNPKPWTM